MNQEEIEEYLTKMLEDSEREIDKVFAGRLQSLLDMLSKWHTKYSDGKQISRTEIYNYRRFEKEMEFIKQNIQSDYKAIHKEIDTLMKAQYVENYLRSGYVYELSAVTDMGYQIPTIATVTEAIANPIAELTLNNLMNEHRNYILSRIRRELAQGIQAGESYSQMAERLQSALGFSRTKARRVARTESGRTQVLGRLKSIEQAEKYANLKRFWMAELDKRTRKAHRNLDGDKVGKDGLFHYRGMKAPGPSLWGVASMDINCRCDIGGLINGKLPEVRRVKDYNNADYQQRLADRIDEIMANEGKTEKQATRKAQKQIFPPSKVVEYQTYEKWYEELKDRG